MLFQGGEAIGADVVKLGAAFVFKGWEVEAERDGRGYLCEAHGRERVTVLGAWDGKG